LAGLSTLALSYLLIERAMRPIVAVALENHSLTTSAAMSIRRRHIVAWGLGSGIPVALIALIPLGREGPHYYTLPVPLIFMSAVALVAGSAVAINLANSLAAPIEGVRDALGRVRSGDLSVEISVDDAGEVGLLQAGVNEMVGGLRERERLHDLFGRHVGEEVARHALEQGIGLRAEQREVSVFFVDLVGSTSLSESRQPNEVIEILNALFTAVVGVVSAEGGWINKFEGDAALCVFGAPVDQPDHADRALRAALRLRDGLVALNDRYAGIVTGVGVSSGRVVAGNIGAEERYEYTVIGSPVNEAARLTDEAKRHPSRLLASRSAIERATVEGRAWKAVGSFSLRGLSEPTEAYEPPAVGA
jgi:adenylate cyclase